MKTGCAVLVIVDRVSYVLLVHDRSGRWGFPKGNVDKGELIIDAAKRETFEETGFQVIPLGEPVKHTHWRRKRKRKEKVWIYAARLANLEVNVPSEQWRRPTWVPLGSLEQLSIHGKFYRNIYKTVTSFSADCWSEEEKLPELYLA